MLQKRMPSIDQGCIRSRESGSNAIQLIIGERCARHSTILDKPKVANYSLQILLDTQDHELLSETILFGDDLYRRSMAVGLIYKFFLVMLLKIPTLHTLNQY